MSMERYDEAPLTAGDLATMARMLRENGVEPTTLHTPAGSFDVRLTIEEMNAAPITVVVAGGDPGYLAREIARYRDDPVAFVQDFGITGQFPAYQEETLRKIAYAFSGVGVQIGGGLPQTGPWGRQSRGWRRHIRRVKAQRNHERKSYVASRL